MLQKPARYLLLIEQAGSMVARLFDADRKHLMDFDATSEEVVTMTAGLSPSKGADAQSWGLALQGHSDAERAAALVYTLDV